MSFLADAHRPGIVRQAGAIYQFRHIELQRRLANWDVSAIAAEDRQRQKGNPAMARAEAGETFW